MLAGGSFDYVVIGAGSAGAVMAARLTEDPGTTVCLIEAGPPDKHPLLHIPFVLAALGKVANINWGYGTTPQIRLNGRRLYWPRQDARRVEFGQRHVLYPRRAGGLRRLGGRRRERLGLGRGLAVFQKAEDQESGADHYHGIGGPLAVSDLRHVSPLSEAFAEASAALQIPRNADFNGERQDGLGLYQVAQRLGKRCSTAVAYLRPAQGRPNLAIWTDSRAEAILFEGRKAAGVRVWRGGARLDVEANREILLCGGAVNSPQLLMLSGIGPAAHLKEHGISVQADRPGVGQNLQDHLDAILQYQTRSRAGYGNALSMIPRAIWGLVNYALFKRGFLTSNIAEAGGFIGVTPGAAHSEVQFHFLPLRIENHGRTRVFGYGHSLHSCCLRPKSRGEIRLASSDAATHPSINPRYLDHEDDARIMVAGVRTGRRILAAPAFERFKGREVDPGNAAQSDADLIAFIRERAETIYHPVGTCRMGRAEDPASVVDPQLRVIGVEALRIVDASVMPTLVRGNTNAPTIMIAERAAEMIRTGA